MNIMVTLYEIRESNRREMPYCHECTTMPTWELKELYTDKPRKAWSCGDHINTVLFDMTYRRTPEAEDDDG